MSKTKKYKKQIKFDNNPVINSSKIPKNLIIILAISVIIAFFVLTNFSKNNNNMYYINNSIFGNFSQESYSSLPYLNPRQYLTLNSPVIGNISSKITIIEFGDFGCPYCKSFYDEQLPLIKLNYIDPGSASFIYLNSPFPILHDKAVDAALGSFCAQEQNNFYPMHNLLFEKQDAWNRIPKETFDNTLLSYAAELKLNQTQFKNCMNRKTYQPDLDAQINASAFLGVSGTPTFFILIKKDKINDFKSKFEQVRANSVSGFVLTPYQNEKDYVVVISGFVDYKTFKAVLDLGN